MADLKPPNIFVFFYYLGRCYCLLVVADVNTTIYLTSLVVVMADGIAKMSLVLYNNHQLLIYYMADVIAMWQMEWSLQGWSVGRCYCHVADGMATGSVHFNLSSEVLNRTSFHM